MKLRTLIASAAVVFLCGGTGVCVASWGSPATPGAHEAASSPAPESAEKPEHHARQHRRRHHGKHHAQKEFTEQQLQQMQAQPPSQ